MKIRLTRKLADMINGVDLSTYRVNQILELPKREAEILLAEGWAERPVGHTLRPLQVEAADRSRHRSRKSSKAPGRR